MTSIKELIALAKAKPGQIDYASGTTGTASFFAAELFKYMAGVNIVNGDTLGDNTSSGTRAVFLFGDVDERYLRTGVDFHFQQQGLRENFDVENITFPALSLGPIVEHFLMQQGKTFSLVLPVVTELPWL